MQVDQQLNKPLEILDKVIEDVASHIQDFTKSPNDFIRNRKLNATTTLKVTLNMQGNSLNAELLDAFPNLDDRMTASAYEQAKDKLKPEVFSTILDEYNKTMIPQLFNDKYRLFAIDGSDFTTPFNPNSQYIVDINSGRKRIDGERNKPYCQIHANILYDIQNRIYQDCEFQPKMQMDERTAATTMLKRLDTNDTPYIVIMDRGYDGFNIIENCNRLDNCYYVIRTKCGNVGIKEITSLPDEEIDTEMTFRITISGQYYKQHKDEKNLHFIQHRRKQYVKERSKNTRDDNWDFGIFENVSCRVVKFQIGDGSWEVLVTNLNRFEFPIEKMKELYHLRWDIETSFRELKYALGGISFHSKKDDFIKMEILSHLIMFNAVSRNIALISVPQTNHKYKYSIDFKMASLLTRKYFTLYNTKDNNSLLVEMLSYINPIRPNRQDKRNMKPKTAIWFVYRVA